MVAVIDSSCICHIAKHTMKGLSTNEMYTGVVFGFLHHVLKFSNVLDTNRFVFAWDSKKNFRRTMFPDYKIGRRTLVKTEEQEELDDITYPQFSELRVRTLPNMGFKHVYIQTGYEADDIIASVVKSNPNHDLTIVSDDTDLYQLLSPNCQIYHPRSKKMITKKDFIEMWNIEPKFWAKAMAIAGCPKDSVPGVDRVGIKTAVKFLNGRLPTHYLAAMRIASDEGMKIVRRNIDLVRLPLSGVNDFHIEDPEEFYLNNFLDVFDTYDFRSFRTPSLLTSWTRQFNLK